MKFIIMTLTCMTFGLVSSACGERFQVEMSTPHVTNGIDIPESEFAETFMLLRDYPTSSDHAQFLCSATFINDHQALTASHCLETYEGKEADLYYLDFKLEAGSTEKKSFRKAKALSATANPKSVSLAPGPDDLAIVNFPPQTAPAVATIYTASLRAGKAVTIVGYGVLKTIVTAGEHGGTGVGTKRKGMNTIARIQGGEIFVHGTAETRHFLKPGQQSVSGPGDSGGALFVDGKLAGVVSSGLAAGKSRGMQMIDASFVDLTTPSSQEFLKEYMDPAFSDINDRGMK